MIILVRYVGVTWTASMFSNVYQLDSHNGSCFALANLRRNICKSRIGDLTFSDLVMVSRSACLSIS